MKSQKQRARLGVHIVLVSTTFLASQPQGASAVPTFGGPVFDTATTTGLNGGVIYLGADIVGNEEAVASMHKYYAGIHIGDRAVRWNAYGEVAELGNLGTDANGRTWAVARSVNGQNVAVGYAWKYAANVMRGVRAVRWDPLNNAAVELSSLGTNTSGYTNTQAAAINENGIIVGWATKYSGNTDLGSRAVRWTAAGDIVELGNTGVSSSGVAQEVPLAVNASGSAVGYAIKTTSGTPGATRPVRWDANGAAQVLGVLGSPSAQNLDCRATEMNDSGTAIGYAQYNYDNGNSNSPRRAVRWSATDTVATQLGILGGTDAYDYQAMAINNTGTAVGYAQEVVNYTVQSTRAVRWNASGTEAEQLATLGGRYSAAYDINENGVTVGDSNRRASAWTSDGTVVDLNTLLYVEDTTLWRLESAVSISDKHWVTGKGTFDPDGPTGPIVGYNRMFLMDVITRFGKQGDATRDNVVNFADLLVLAQHYGQSTAARWDDGDFSGDGGVDFSDLLIIAQNYGASLNAGNGTTTSGEFAADWSRALSLVPEPTGLTLFCFAPLRRRRNRFG